MRQAESARVIGGARPNLDVLSRSIRAQANIRRAATGIGRNRGAAKGHVVGFQSNHAALTLDRAAPRVRQQFVRLRHRYVDRLAGRDRRRHVVYREVSFRRGDRNIAIVRVHRRERKRSGAIATLRGLHRNVAGVRRINRRDPHSAVVRVQQIQVDPAAGSLSKRQSRRELQVHRPIRDADASHGRQTCGSRRDIRGAIGRGRIVDLADRIDGHGINGDQGAQRDVAARHRRKVDVIPGAPGIDEGRDDVLACGLEIYRAIIGIDVGKRNLLILEFEEDVTGSRCCRNVFSVNQNPRGLGAALVDPDTGARGDFHMRCDDVLRAVVPVQNRAGGSDGNRIAAAGGRNLAGDNIVSGARIDVHIAGDVGIFSIVDPQRIGIPIGISSAGALLHRSIVDEGEDMDRTGTGINQAGGGRPL